MGTTVDTISSGEKFNENSSKHIGNALFNKLVISLIVYSVLA